MTLADARIPLAVTVAAAVAILLGGGVTPGELVRFAAYELGLVALPGWLLFVALTGRGGLGLRALTTGWALGYAIELAGFALTASLDLRDLLPFLQVGVAVSAVAAIRRRRTPLRRGSEDTGGSGAGWAWAGAAIAIAALAFLSGHYFERAPLPDEVRSVTYAPDIPLQVALTAELENHWPATVPSLSGEPLHYHYFVHMHMAAVGQVTGIDASVVVLRLLVVPMLLLAVGQLLELGRRVAKNVWIGVLAAALVFVVGILEFLPWPPGEIVRLLYLSPSFAFGLVFFGALLIELHAKLYERGRSTASWVVIAALLAAAVGAKSSVVPVLGGALAVLLALAWRRGGVQTRPLAIAAGLAALILLASLVVLYRGGGDLALEPFGIVTGTEAYADAADSLPDAFPLRGAFWVAAALGGLVKQAAPLLPGLALALAAWRLRPPPAQRLLLACFAVAIVPVLVVNHPQDSQLYFFWYGYVAAAIPSAAASPIAY